MTKLSDYVVRFLASRGVDTFFTVSGGGIMHMLESVGSTPGVCYYCNYHEQASAIAAEGWARVKNRPAAVLVTVGPGALNAISGVAGAWFDSVPMIVLSGQLRRDLIADHSKIRQLGPQEGPTVAMAAPITKYAKTVMEPQSIRYELEKALHLAVSGRPGPVWLDLPLDVQAAEIDESALPRYVPEPDRGAAAVAAQAMKALEMLAASKRPVLVGGTGLYWAGAKELFIELAEQLGIPVVLPYTGKDLISEDHPLNMGIFGTTGQRRANFTVQNADLMLSLGSGLCVSKVGFNAKGFAPKARKIIVDIDVGQTFDQIVKPDLGIVADAGDFLRELLRQAAGRRFTFSPKWRRACSDWRAKYPIMEPDYYKDPSHVNSYVFMDRLAARMGADQVLVTGNALDAISYMQGFSVKPGQRTFTSNNWGSMGWALPLAIGACIGNDGKPTICVTGDGSVQWNIQELLYLQLHRLPVKIFILNNRGYSSIRATQNAFFQGHFVGADETSGVANADFRKLADAYGLSYLQIGTYADLDAGIARVLETPGPVICDLDIAPTQGSSPKASAFRNAAGKMESRPLEDMSPPLSREEVHQNMHQFDDEENSATGAAPVGSSRS